MKKVLIAGIGNILLGDDGVGPYIARLLAARFTFDENVEVLDLGTPSLDLADHISGKEAVIIIDSVDTEAAPGSVLLYRKADIMRHGSAVRMDTHSPALVSTLLRAEFFGAAPRDVLLVGVRGKSYDCGCNFSDSVKASETKVIEEVLSELRRLEVNFECLEHSVEIGIWWTTGGVPSDPPRLGFLGR